MGYRFDPLIPMPVAVAFREMTKEELAEILWDLFMQSPWFDETSALRDMPGVIAKAHEIRKLYRTAHKAQDRETRSAQ